MTRRLLLLGFGALVVTGCGSEKPLDTFGPKGSKAESIDTLMIPVFIVAAIVLVLVFGAVGYMWWRYRVPGPESGDFNGEGVYGDDEFPPQIHGNSKLEIGWTVAPAVLLAVIGVFTLATLFELDDVEAQSTDRPLEIVVVGQQWWWEYQYHLDGDASDGPPDFVTANEAVIPVGQEVRIFPTSRDVIHSFWIPQLNGKKDAVPGRVHPWVIQANVPGRFAGTCTEFCGLSHAYMRMYVVALAGAEYELWVENQLQPQTPPEEGDATFRGWEVFESQCARCHMVVGSTARDLDDDPETPDQPDGYEVYGSRLDYLSPSTGAMLGMYTGPENLTAGAAPNLTHFASRTSYAGSFFQLYFDADEILAEDPNRYLAMADFAKTDREQLEAWIRNAPEQKPNRTDNLQGMPALNLSEDDIDAVVDYLLTLD